MYEIASVIAMDGCSNVLTPRMSFSQSVAIEQLVKKIDAMVLTPRLTMYSLKLSEGVLPDPPPSWNKLKGKKSMKLNYWKRIISYKIDKNQKGAKMKRSKHTKELEFPDDWTTDQIAKQVLECGTSNNLAFGQIENQPVFIFDHGPVAENHII